MAENTAENPDAEPENSASANPADTAAEDPAADAEPPATCWLEDNTLTLYQDTVAALELEGEEGAVYTLSQEESSAWELVRLEDMLVFRALEPGEGMLRITSEADGFEPIDLELQVQVTLPPVDVELNADGFDPVDMRVEEGKALSFQIACEPQEAELEVVSADEAVANVSVVEGRVTVTGVEKGNTVVTLTARAEGRADSVQELPVEVCGPQAAMTLSCPVLGKNNQANLPVGQATTVTVATAQGAAVTCTASGDAIEVAQQGNRITVKGVKEGVARLVVTGSQEGLEDNVQTITFTVSYPGIALSLSQKSLNLAPEKSETLTYTVTPADAVVSAQSSNDRVSVTCADGVITVQPQKRGSGVVTVTAQKEGYQTRTVQLPFRVTHTPIQLTVSPAYISAPLSGGSISASYTVNPAGATVSASVSPNIADISCSEGTLTITPKQGGHANITLIAQMEGYESAVRTVGLYLEAPRLSLTVSPSSLSFSAGESLEENLSVSATPADATVAYSATEGIRLSGQSNTGVHVSADVPGTITITASKDGYETVRQTVRVTSSGTAKVDVEEFAYEIYKLTNQERVQAGLQPLEWRSELAGAAQIRAAEIVQKFSHTRPNGQSFSSILIGIVTPKCHKGENINKGYPSPAEAVQGWMNSPGHRANILDEDYTDIGVGVYQANGIIHCVQLFCADFEQNQFFKNCCPGCTNDMPHTCTGDLDTCTCTCPVCSGQTARPPASSSTPEQPESSSSAPEESSSSSQESSSSSEDSSSSSQESSSSSEDSSSSSQESSSSSEDSSSSSQESSSSSEDSSSGDWDNILDGNNPDPPRGS